MSSWTSLTHEKVIRVWHISTNAKQLHQIMKLAMNVAAYLRLHMISMSPAMNESESYCHGRINANHIALFYK